MASRPDIAQASTPELFAGVLADAKEIAIGHLGRIRGEIADELGELKSYLVRVVMAVGVMVIAAVLAGETLAHALIALGMPSWVGYLVGMVIALGVCYALVKKLPSNKKDIDLIPESSLEHLKRDVADVGEKVTH